MSQLCYTLHAEQRMRERGISEAEVDAVYTYPEYTFPTVDGATAYVGERIVVVVGRRRRVVTAHLREETRDELPSRPLNPGKRLS